MSEIIRRSRPGIARRARRGQTLIVALAVLFVLLFIGGLFVAQIGRNLVTTGRSRDQQDAQALAEAGIRFCDSQLTSSEDGADWRPAPTPPLTQGGDPQGLADPDYFWLNQGFTRVFFSGGRALVRVTYDPHPDDPRSQLIKIEAVGRPGDLAQGLDPTVFVQNGPAPRLRRELIAYKQIGLTDYLRFMTGKDHNVSPNFLGTPAIGRFVATVFGDANIGNHPTGVNTVGPDQYLLFGGGIRSNSDLQFGGDTFVYASPRGNADPLLSPEGVQTSGSISLSPTRDVNGDGVIDDNDIQSFINQPINTGPAPNAANAILPSASPNASTVGGLVRDGSAQPDAKGYTNSIPRLDPPVIDSYVNGSGVLRYRALTRDSGRLATGPNGRFNSGAYGWGRGVYINNPDDLQSETVTPGINGSYSLRADWLNPGARFGKGYWQGPFYIPPGVMVDLLGNHIRLTRTDSNIFYNPDGTPATQLGGKVIDIPLTDFDRQHYRLPDGTLFPLPPLDHDGDDPNAPNSPYNDKSSYGVNLVIMAEGNVRVRGVYGAITSSSDTAESGDPANNDPNIVRKLGRVHLTIVSGGTAYIDGNIVKGDGFLDSAQVPAVQRREHASTCAILAKDYVCVNTTMFMAPSNQNNVWSRLSNDLNAFNTELGMTRQSYDTTFSFGEDPSLYTVGAGQSNVYLMTRHAALTPGPALINMLVNPGLPPPPGVSSLYPFTAPNATPLPFETYALGLKYIGTLFLEDKFAITPQFEQRGFLLGNTVNGVNLPFITAPGYDNVLRFQMDQTAQGRAIGLATGSGGSTTYLLGGVLVAPLDIRIEALLYAQEKSFFVIPGYSFNPDPSDTREAFASTGTRASYKGDVSYTGPNPPQDKQYKDLFPFYGEPMDVRITVFGAISENYTASMGDQAAWMARWGYVPTAFGSSAQTVPDMHLRAQDSQENNPGEDTGADLRTPGEAQVQITRGLRFLYDPALALPYYRPTLLAPYLNNDSTDKRAGRALRYRVRPAVVQNGLTILPEIRQTLPPTPRLPVCPGLLYFGDSDHPIGND
jgi:hypothetical protein